MIVLLLAASLGLVASQTVSYRNCPGGKKWVKVGDNFDLTCRSPDGIAYRIHTPDENIQAAEDLVLTAQAQDPDFYKADISTKNSTFLNVQRHHTGIYTCLVYHSFAPHFSTLECEIIILDLCEGHTCDATIYESCVGDYTTGTSSCECPVIGDPDCSTEASFHCSDTCELFWNNCQRKQKTCDDKIPREVMFEGFCPSGAAKFPPQVTDMPDTYIMNPELGQVITMTSGIRQAGNPITKVHWTHDGTDLGTTTDLETYVFTFDGPGSAGTYEARVVYCREDADAVVNRYIVISMEETTTEPLTTSPVTEWEEPDKASVGGWHTCSSYPGGVIDQFAGASLVVDLACTHVLAADFMPGGDITAGWYIYGTYDTLNGDPALSSMTFFVGDAVFEVQRGWLVNVGGVKQVLEQMEGEDGEEDIRGVDIGPCSVTFKDVHMEVSCGFFDAVYDGLMAGHIVINPAPMERTAEDPVKTAGTIGLCWDNESGFRPNWQIGGGDSCDVDTDAPACGDERPDICKGFEKFLPGPSPSLPGWLVHGEATMVSCEELRCAGKTPTADQVCAYLRAGRVSEYLKTSGMVYAGDFAECPTKDCAYKQHVVAQGCPQPNPPFECPGV